VAQDYSGLAFEAFCFRRAMVRVTALTTDTSRLLEDENLQREMVSPKRSISVVYYPQHGTQHAGQLTNKSKLSSPTNEVSKPSSASSDKPH
jgi:hypothetical protein